MTCLSHSPGPVKERLSSLLDLMNRIETSKLIDLVNSLASIQAHQNGIETAYEALNVSVGAIPDVAVNKHPLKPFLLSEDEGLRTLINGIVDRSEALCGELNLSVSLGQVRRIRILLGLERINTRQIGDAFSELRNRVRDELSSMVVLKIDTGQERFFEADNLFGDRVSAAFPAASYDIQEAGSCFACGRWSASVFHLMRALEVPLGILAGIVDIAFDSGNWNKTLNEFDAALSKALKENSANKQNDWKAKEEFYSGASALLRNVKNAWRNSINHRVHSYDEDRAKSILNSVESIMKHLATNLAETPAS